MLFVTPEYNRSVPGVLKNAIDVGSRPYGKSAWNGKPGAVISVSPGAIGGFGANHHLRQSLVFLNVPAMQQPEAYIGGAGKLFDDAGAIEEAGDEGVPRQVPRRVRGLDRADGAGARLRKALSAASRRPSSPPSSSSRSWPRRAASLSWRLSLSWWPSPS